MVNNYQTIIFDWDGCLANTLETWLDAYQKAFKSRGLNLSTQDVVEKAFGNWNAAKAFGIRDSEGFMKEVVAEGVKGLKEVRLNPNAKSILQLFKDQGKKLALISTSKRDWVLPALEYHKLADFFDIFIGAEDVKKHKPNPESIYTVLEKFNCEKESTIIIGDSDKDILAGKNAGIDTCLYYPKENEAFYTRDFIENLRANYTIKDFMELGNKYGNNQ
jgi:HAD superfamily hydrolase (TIGR01509 family)